MQRSATDIRNGVIYVSVWVMIWGTLASVADAILLGRDAYETGTYGQALTFAAYGVAAVVLAIRYAPRFLKADQEDSEANKSS
jgi:membrane protein implicated in regulation of membrane protease activity